MFLVVSVVELMVGAFLAFETRNVNIKELSDSRLIALSIYSICIVCVALTPIAFLLNEFVTEQYAIMGALLLASVTFILCVLFVPKVCAMGSGCVQWESGCVQWESGCVQWESGCVQ